MLSVGVDNSICKAFLVMPIYMSLVGTACMQMPYSPSEPRRECASLYVVLVPTWNALRFHNVH